MWHGLEMLGLEFKARSAWLQSHSFHSSMLPFHFFLLLSLFHSNSEIWPWKIVWLVGKSRPKFCYYMWLAQPIFTVTDTLADGFDLSYCHHDAFVVTDRTEWGGGAEYLNNGNNLKGIRQPGKNSLSLTKITTTSKGIFFSWGRLEA